MNLKMKKSITTDLMNVKLNCFGDDVRVDGQEDDEGRSLVGKQHVNRIQYWKDLK